MEDFEDLWLQALNKIESMRIYIMHLEYEIQDLEAEISYYQNGGGCA
jgi:hypothetical protein